MGGRSAQSVVNAGQRRAVTDLDRIGEANLSAILALNNEHARELSWLELPKLRHLVGEAFLALRAGEADAFLLAFDQDADYDSENFLWFKARYARFAYVDRVAVASHARGRGLARAFYETLFEKARAAGHTVVTCEVNSDPPNPGSDAFHAAMGFREVGSAAIYGGERTVRYFVRDL
ncbi:MAG: GNAT family N-acetyltransferase [Mesorhizobium sp.]|nr:GNAT family N-acetyltransferase [Mesorhizobium sp.]MCO5162340.1 GNAT family N-acetyltransferase [Mesorhizobium sp.]